MRSTLGFIASNDPEALAGDAAFATEHGFQGLEFNFWGNFSELTAETVSRMRDALDAHEQTCSMLGLWGWNHLSNDAAERAEAHEMLGRAIEFGKTLGAEFLTTGGGQVYDASPAENVAEFAKVFPPLLDRIRQAGMTPCMYPLHGHSFFDGIEAYEAVWEAGIDVTIKFDPANWKMKGLDWLDVARRHGGRIGYLHVKEIIHTEGKPASQPAAGMGDIAWGKLFAFLYEHEYDGPLSIEPHGPLWGQGPLRETMLLLTQRHISQFLL